MKVGANCRCTIGGDESKLDPPENQACHSVDHSQSRDGEHAVINSRDAGDF